MTSYNPIQYLSAASYKSNEVLVRLDRTSIAPPSGVDPTYEHLPKNFVDLLNDGLVGLDKNRICPLFLDGVALLKPPYDGIEDAIRRGIQEYLPDLELYGRENGALKVSRPIGVAGPNPAASLSPAQVVNALTNFRLLFDSPANALAALDLLNALPSVAMAELAPARYIVVAESQGETGPPRPVERRKGGSEVLGERLTAEDDATEHINININLPDPALYKLVEDMNKNIAAMLEELKKSKCCKEEKPLPDKSFEQWPFTALHSQFDQCRGEKVMVALFDLGVDWTHVDMKDRVEIGLSNVKPNPLEMAKNLTALPDPLNPGQVYYPLLKSESVLAPNQGLNCHLPRGFHGTAVAGVMIGKYTGFLPKGRVLSYQVSSGTPFEYTAGDGTKVKYFPVDSVLYASALFSLSARNTDVSVVNVSLGGAAPLCEFEKIGYAALASVNILAVACTGNHFRKGDDAFVLYPARHEGILSVGAVAIEKSTQYYRRAAWSNYDEDDYHVNIMAPGANIYSCIPRSYGRKWDCSWFNGTSFAAPWVSAIYAWALQQKLTFELPDVSQKLYYQKKDDPFDGENGYGLIKLDKLQESGKKKGCVVYRLPPCAPVNPPPKPVYEAAPGQSYGQ